MKKLFPIIIFAVSCLFAACSSTASDNGDMDAMWYLIKVDSLSNGKSVEYRSQRVFWAFQGTLFQMYCVDHPDYKYMGRFERKANTLRIYSPFKYDRMNGDEYLTNDNISVVSSFGINALEENFDVEALNGDEMILKGSTLRLTFEHY